MADEFGGSPVRVHYRALYDGGKVWVESRDPREVVSRSEGRDVTFERMEVFEVTDGWGPWDPRRADRDR